METGTDVPMDVPMDSIGTFVPMEGLSLKDSSKIGCQIKSYPAVFPLNLSIIPGFVTAINPFSFSSFKSFRTALSVTPISSAISAWLGKHRPSFPANCASLPYKSLALADIFLYRAKAFGMNSPTKTLNGLNFSPGFGISSE